MPRKSEIEKLPISILEELETKLLNHDYQSIQELIDQLRAEGFSFSIAQIKQHDVKVSRRPKPIMATIRKDLKGEGFEFSCTDQTLEMLLLRLAAVRFKENILMLQLLQKQKK